MSCSADLVVHLPCMDCTSTYILATSMAFCIVLAVPCLIIPMLLLQQRMLIQQSSVVNNITAALEVYKPLKIMMIIEYYYI